ncbi:hypothetical protein AVEN_73218-1, partial [Araneus ventricosus]
MFVLFCFLAQELFLAKLRHTNGKIIYTPKKTHNNSTSVPPGNLGYLPTGQPPRHLCRSYWVSLLFIHNYKEKLVAQHSTDLDFLFLQTSVISIPVKLKKTLRDGQHTHRNIQVQLKFPWMTKATSTLNLEFIPMDPKQRREVFLRNTVFQAEILALLKIVECAFSLPTQQLTILVDNQANIKSAANPKSQTTIAQKIFKLLHSHPHIIVLWIKAQAGYIGIEEADRLAKKAAEKENFPETPLELPKSFIKTFLRQKIMTTGELASDDEDTGRLIHNIILKISLQHRSGKSTGHTKKFCSSRDMDPSLCFYKDSTLPELHSVLVGELAHQSIMPWFA